MKIERFLIHLPTFPYVWQMLESKGKRKSVRDPPTKSGGQSKKTKPLSARERDERSVEDIYGQLTDAVHARLRPDTFFGSVTPQTVELFTRPPGGLKPLDDKKDAKVTLSDLPKMVLRSVTIVPAFFKMFDEILVNAADNFMNRKRVGTQLMNRLEIDIDREKGRIRVWNNGKSIPVEIHKEAKKYCATFLLAKCEVAATLTTRKNAPPEVVMGMGPN